LAFILKVLGCGDKMETWIRTWSGCFKISIENTFSCHLLVNDSKKRSPATDKPIRPSRTAATSMVVSGQKSAVRKNKTLPTPQGIVNVLRD
jgi:hypothetical protein